MKRRILAIAVLSAPLLLVACYGPPPGAADDDDDPPPPGADCALDSQGADVPGYPFDVETFRSDVLPVLAAACGSCHNAPAGAGGFIMWSDASVDDCNFGKTFNQVAKQINLSAPGDSRLLRAPSGGSTTHPRVLESTTPGYATVKSYVDEGAAAFAGDDDLPSDGLHDATVFTSTIQPMLDSYGCSNNGCHGTGAGSFKLIKAAAGADLAANFVEVTKRNDLASPDRSRVYVKGLAAHAGSRVLSAADAKKFLDWVTAAANKAP